MKHFKVLKNISITILIINLASIQISFGTFAFGDNTHKQLSKLAFCQVLKDRNLTQYLKATPFLENNSIAPDKDEIIGEGGPYEAHFFNIETDLDKSDTALTRMEKHFRSSVRAASEENWVHAIEELARSLHYIQDMCCPVHVWGYEQNKISKHIPLENLWNSMWESGSAKIPLGMCFSDSIVSDGRYFKANRKKNIKELGEFVGNMSLQLYGDWITGSNKVNWSVLNNMITFTRYSLANSREIDLVLLANNSSGIESNDWEKVFYLPYLASYELINMWAVEVLNFSFPHSECNVQ